MSADAAKPHAYVICGMHGGYFLTDRNDFDAALGYVEAFLGEHPHLNYSMEIEAYALDRFVRGPQLNVEKRHYNWRRNDYPDAWLAPGIAARMKALVGQGRLDNVSTYTQPILHALDGEAVVRQFGYARRIQREVLGIELEYYGAQEPCWCGQIPAILKGFNMKGCMFETSWGPFGFAPLKNGEKFRWRGPDGSEIAVVPANPGMRDPCLEREKETERHFMPWQNPMYLALNAKTINEARAQGLENPVQLCLSLDFTSHHPRHWFDSTQIVNDDCDITFTTLGLYLETARDDGAWDDAFAEFEDRMCWGVKGGQVYLQSQATANRTILAQRLSVLQGYDHREEEDKMWQATMVGHHHDAWLGFSLIFGIWDYDTYYDLIVACRKEVEARADALFPGPGGGSFQVTNPTQRARREWLELDMVLPEGAVRDAATVVDAHGDAVPTRLQVTDQHADGSAGRVKGFLLATVDGFRSAEYTVVGTGESPTVLPGQVVRNEGAWTIRGDRLKAVVSTEGIRLFRDDVECVSDLFLHAKVEGWDDRSTITDIEGELESSGIARVRAKGVIGCIPFTLDIRIKPWSDRFDVHVGCDYEGELTEGTNFWEQDGNLKLMARYPRPVANRLHHPFELRAPSDRTHSAVHFVQADHEDGNGCVLILDRPSGVVADADSTGIALCHSGWGIFDLPTRTGVKGVNGQRYNNGRVRGLQEYDLQIRPYAPGDRASALCAYQDQAYPLQATTRQTGSLPIPAIDVEGHSIVSNLSREADGIVLRLWNPLERETIVLRAPGMRLTLVDLEGGEIEELGNDEAALDIGTMQIKSIRLQAG